MERQDAPARTSGCLSRLRDSSLSGAGKAAPPPQGASNAKAKAVIKVLPNRTQFNNK